MTEGISVYIDNLVFIPSYMDKGNKIAVIYFVSIDRN